MTYASKDLILRARAARGWTDRYEDLIRELADAVPMESAPEPHPSSALLAAARGILDYELNSTDHHANWDRYYDNLRRAAEAEERYQSALAVSIRPWQELVASAQKERDVALARAEEAEAHADDNQVRYTCHKCMGAVDMSKPYQASWVRLHVDNPPSDVASVDSDDPLAVWDKYQRGYADPKPPHVQAINELVRRALGGE